VVLEATTDLAENNLRDKLWSAIRAADLLQALPAVHGERIGYLGDALDGRLLAAIDQRFVATVALGVVPADSTIGVSDAELTAAIAPRAVLIALPPPAAPAAAIQQAATDASAVYELRGVPDKLVVFGADRAETEAAPWLQRHLQGRRGPR
jgi:hypothetical protein